MNVWFSSDWHFGHERFLQFKNEDGSPIRPFKTVEDMNECMVARHNERVGPHDKFYTLGDVAFKLDVLHAIMPRLNGKMRLILGNHDHFKMSEYMKYFTKIMESWQPVRNVVFTHRPIQIGGHHEKIRYNCHGHIHQNLLEDPRYLNLCVEHHDYSPVHWNEIVEKLNLKTD